MGKPMSVEAVLKVVVWDDAWSAGIEVMTMKEAKERHKASIMQTIGWVVESNDEGITLFNERCMDKGEECYRGHSFIPRVLVKSETPFKLATPRKKAPREKVPVPPPDVG
jgi:hypothetical protein